MTIEEAIEELKINAGKEPLEISGSARRMIKYFEALATASEALEKQIPKDIYIYANGTEHCPNCDHDITQISFDDVYCSRCGQKLKKGE
jgi:formamidopyrimidine-DNA glycosylase